MTAPTTTNTKTPAPARANGGQPATDAGKTGSETELEDLARAQEELRHEIRSLVAPGVLDEATDDSPERTGRLDSVARAPEDLIEPPTRWPTRGCASAVGSRSASARASGA